MLLQTTTNAKKTTHHTMHLILVAKFPEDLVLDEIHIFSLPQVETLWCLYYGQLMIFHSVYFVL